MAQIAGARIGWTTALISEITTGDHSKRADGRKCACLRAAQGVLAIAVAHDLSLPPTRQIEVARKRVAGIEGALRRLAVAISRACIVAWIASARIAWTAAECSRVVVIAIA